MELRDYIRILRKNWILIVVATLVGLGASATYTFLQTPMYESRSEVYVSAQGASTIGEVQQGSSYTQARVASWVQLASTPRVLERVIEDLGLEVTPSALVQQLEVASPTGTAIIAITVADADPERAAEVANAVTESLSQAIAEVERLPGTNDSPVNVSQVATATPVDSPSSPRIPLNLVIGTIIGMALGITVAVLRAVLDTRIQSSRDLESVTEAPVIGAIPLDKQAKERPIIMKEDPLNPRSEAFRSLRTNLQFLDVEGGHTFIVTSSIPGEGKSTTSVNLAIALADAGKNTILIDGDLRKPMVAEYLGIEGGVGLTDVLIGRAEAEDVFQQWGNRSLLVLPAGRIPPNPSELLNSDRMKALLHTVEHAADVVIIDCPPLLPVTDAAILARATSGAIVAVAANKTTRIQLSQALENLDNVDARVAGITLTMLPDKGAEEFGYAYGYGYGYGPHRK